MLIIKNNQHLQRTASQGFTLVELMIVLAILAIVATFAIPSFRTWMADTKTRSVAENIQNGLRIAKAEAVKRGVRVQFVLTDDAPNAKEVVAKSTGKNWVVQSMNLASSGDVEDFIEGAPLSKEAGKSLVSASSGEITFNSLGRVVVPNKAVEYTVKNADYGKRTLKVQVSISGKIRMCDPGFTLSSTHPMGCA